MSCGRARLILAEAQRLSHTGSFGWHVSSGELFWSDQTCRIIGVDEGIESTLDLVFQRIYPEDIARVQEIFDCGVQAGTDRILNSDSFIPDGSVNHVHVVGACAEK